MKTPIAIAKGTRTRARGTMFRTEESGPVKFETMQFTKTTFLLAEDPGIKLGPDEVEVVAELDLSENIAYFKYEVTP